MKLEQAKTLALQLMNQHKLIENGWTFNFNRAKTSLGQCNNTTRTISLSVYFVEKLDVSVIQNTILHEIAHALTPGHHHDEVWRRKAIEIGCSGERCFRSEERIVKGKYSAKCNNCGKTYHRHRKPKYSKYRCGVCPDSQINDACILMFSVQF